MEDMASPRRPLSLRVCGAVSVQKMHRCKRSDCKNVHLLWRLQACAILISVQRQLTYESPSSLSLSSNFAWRTACQQLLEGFLAACSQADPLMCPTPLMSQWWDNAQWIPLHPAPDLTLNKVFTEVLEFHFFINHLSGWIDANHSSS